MKITNLFLFFTEPVNNFFPSVFFQALLITVFCSFSPHYNTSQVTADREKKSVELNTTLMELLDHEHPVSKLQPWRWPFLDKYKFIPDANSLFSVTDSDLGPNQTKLL